MSELTADLERSIWSAEYLLAHCEGFLVESDERTLGYVEEVVRAGDCGDPLALRVRAGFDEHGIVTIEDVVELHAAGERIVVRSRKRGHARPARAHRSPARPKQRARAFERELRPAPKLAAR